MRLDWFGWFVLGSVAGATAGFSGAWWITWKALKFAMHVGVFHAPRNCPTAKAARDAARARGEL